VSFLIEIAVSSNKAELLSHKDIQGDTALHAAALKGNLLCCELLLYYLRNEPNNQGIKAGSLAHRVGQARISNMIDFYSVQFTDPSVAASLEAATTAAEVVFECKFELLSSVLLYHGSRWTKLYDPTHNSTYYYDRVTGVSCWDEPAVFDMDEKTERRDDQARQLLVMFYSKFNAAKLGEINDIMFVYKNRYTELFISLANKYEIDDLSMFAGVSFEE
jgi:hypothetical protein